MDAPRRKVSAFDVGGGVKSVENCVDVETHVGIGSDPRLLIEPQPPLHTRQSGTIGDSKTLTQRIEALRGCQNVCPIIRLHCCIRSLLFGRQPAARSIGRSALPMWRDSLRQSFLAAVSRCDFPCSRTSLASRSDVIGVTHVPFIVATGRPTRDAHQAVVWSQRVIG